MNQKTGRTWFVFAFLVCLFVCFSAFASADSKAAIWPEQTTVTNTSGKLMLDASGASDGYFFAAISRNTTHRLKLRVIKDGTTLTYDLKPDTSYELFPFQLGAGYYEIYLYENVSGKKYSQEGVIGINVKMDNPDAAFLVPSQYISYTKASEAIAMADSLFEGKGEKEAFEAVCKFMSTSFAGY